MSSEVEEKKLCETYKDKKINDFKQDLNLLLDRYSFSGWNRSRIETECLAIAEEQIKPLPPSQLELTLVKDKEVTP